MPWFFIDDHLAMHPKAVEAGNAAMGLWVRAGSWCAAHLTDGSLPAAMVTPLGGRARDANRLVEVGLWEQPDGRRGDYVFKDWPHYQKSKVQVETEREVKREQNRRAYRKRSVPTEVPTEVPTQVPTSVAPPSLPFLKEEIQETPKTPAGDGPEFVAFWNVYPSRTGKGQARLAFAKALKKADLQTIVDGATRYRDDPSRNPSYTKNPTTWLNGECWADEKPAAPTQVGGRAWEE